MRNRASLQFIEDRRGAAHCIRIFLDDLIDRKSLMTASQQSESNIAD